MYLIQGPLTSLAASNLRRVATRLFCSRSLMASLILLLCLPMAWSQYPTAIYATSGSHYSNGIAANTSPGVTIFNNEALIVWCGTGGYVQTVLQEYPGYAGTVNTTSIPCASGGGRISVAAFGSNVYAIGQPLNTSSYDAFTMISSSDGVNWTSYNANVTYDGYTDGTFDEGFGLNSFTPTGGSQELVLSYASTYNGGVGPSVATSTDGVNFAWQAVVSSDPMYDETSSWDQSPAVLNWTTGEGAPSGLSHSKRYYSDVV